MDPAYGLEHMDRVYVSRMPESHMDLLGHMGQVYVRCVRMDPGCGSREGTGVVVVADMGSCNHSEHTIHHNLLGCCLYVSSTLCILSIHLQGSLGYAFSTPPPPAPNPASPASVIILSLGRLPSPAGGYPYPTL